MNNHADCVFCGLLSGSLPASVVCSDDHVMAVMTIRPAHTGHVLLFPREHVEDFALLDESTRAHLFQVAGRLKSAICEAVPCSGFQLLINQGEPTGQKQDCKHLHLHLVPRNLGDGVDLAEHVPEAPRAELDKTALDIAKRLKTGS